MYNGPFARKHPRYESSSFAGASFDPDGEIRTTPPSNVPVTPAEIPPPQRPELLMRLYEMRAHAAEFPEFAQRLDSLLEQFAPLWAEGEALESQFAKSRRRKLESQYQQIRKEGRAQDRSYKQLTLQYADAEQAAQAAGLRAEAAREQLANLDLLQKRGLHLPRWYDESELGEWNVRISAAKDGVTALNQAYADAIAVRSGIAEKLRAAEAELEKIGTEEIRLRRRLEGRDYVDPELGLKVSAT